MSVNKVLLGTEVLLAVDQDTATPDKVLSGYTFHDASGTQQTGTARAYMDGTTCVLPSATVDGTTVIL